MLIQNQRYKINNTFWLPYWLARIPPLQLIVCCPTPIHWGGITGGTFDTFSLKRHQNAHLDARGVFFIKWNCCSLCFVLQFALCMFVIKKKKLIFSSVVVLPVDSQYTMNSSLERRANKTLMTDFPASSDLVMCLSLGRIPLCLCELCVSWFGPLALGRTAVGKHSEGVRLRVTCQLSNFRTVVLVQFSSRHGIWMLLKRVFKAADEQMLHSSPQLNCLHSRSLWTNKQPHSCHTRSKNASGNALRSLKYAKLGNGFLTQASFSPNKAETIMENNLW